MTNQKKDSCFEKIRKMAERTVSSRMSLKTQESMRRKLEEWRKTKAQKQLNCKTPMKTSNRQETHMKQQPSIKNIRKSMPYGSSSIHRAKENKGNRELKKKSLNATSTTKSSLTAGRKWLKTQEVTNEEQNPIPSNHLTFSENPPKNFYTESDIGLNKSRRSTLTKEELVFNENPPSNFEIESEPDAKKARRSTFTVDSPNPFKDVEGSKPEKAAKSQSKFQSKSMKPKLQNKTMKVKEIHPKRSVKKDLPRKIPIKRPETSKPPQKSMNTSIKKPEERKSTFVAKPTGKKPTQTINCAVPTKQSNFHKTCVVKTTYTHDKSLSMRQRLEMWRKEKGIVTQLPKTPLMQRKPSASKEKNKNCTKSGIIKKEQSQPLQVIENENTKKETTSNIKEKIQEYLERLKSEDNNFDEMACQLDEIPKNHKEALQFAEYWVCRAEIAKKSGDHSRVLCLYQQAVAFNAEPSSLIQEKMSTLTMDTNTLQENNQEKLKEDYQAMTAGVSNDTDCQQQLHQPSEVPTHVTPNKATCTAEFISPSSTIRYSVTKATPYRSRRKTCERPTVTPVRRSVRLERRSIHYPPMLQDHNLIVRHLDDLPCDIKDDVSFKPNFTVKSELNDAWKEIMEC